MGVGEGDGGRTVISAVNLAKGLEYSWVGERAAGVRVPRRVYKKGEKAEMYRMELTDLVFEIIDDALYAQSAGQKTERD
jgi:hypothetical protein